jgi:alkylated DNA repair dioxygenase AlkB
MSTLFPIEPVWPPGFSYFPGFIGETEELGLLQEISRLELHVFNFHGYEAKRRVASFGYDYSFEKRTISRAKQIPGAFDDLIQKVASHTGIRKENFAELLITEYPIGSVINWHRDAFPFDVIAGISLASDCTFRFRPHEKIKQVRGSVIPIHLQQRSLYIIQGQARSEWQHSISPVKSVRYSITLRTLKPP